MTPRFSRPRRIDRALQRVRLPASALALLISLASLACSDDIAPARTASLVVVQAPSGTAHNNEALRRQPVVQLADGSGNPIMRRGVTISARPRSGAVTIRNATAVTDSAGRASFQGLALQGGLGAYEIDFTGDGLTSAAYHVNVDKSLCDGGAPLDLPVGGFERYVTTDPSTPRCLEFHATQNADQQYLVLFENMPREGDFRGALFPASGAASPNTFVAGVAAAPATEAAASDMSAALLRARVMASPARRENGWDFGSGPIYEGTPAPPEGVATSAFMHGLQMSLRSSLPAVGDTVQVYMEGIARLGIDNGTQHAVVRYITDDIIFADDIRLGTTLTRTNRTHNTPLTIAQMDTIAREYAAYAKVQSNRFFQGRFNAATEGQQSRVIAIHSLTYDDRLWGYTYPYANYLVYDYWVGTDGHTAGNNQVLQRVADDLFMHEIAHTRHGGMLERATPSRTLKRGNQWLTEGFARFTERMPIAMRLLGTATPSRTSNFVLARNPVFPGGAYFFDDVPTYLDAGSSVFDGYQSSSYVFDYLADQVAMRGGDYEAALRDVLLNGGVESDLDGAVGRWMPGMRFGELLTRARVALYTDDYGSGLPAWTQYTQYQLRASRPPGSRTASDPRNLWPKLAPGATFAENRSLLPGAAFGYVIDGTAGQTDSRIMLTATSATNGVVSITRIR